MRQRTTFVRSVGDSVEMQMVTRADDGSVLGEPTESTAAWRELQAHASFDAARTEIAPVRFRFGDAPEEGWLYTVLRDAGGRTLVQRYWFARDRAGPPIRVEVRSGDRVLQRMTMVDDGRNPN